MSQQKTRSKGTAKLWKTFLFRRHSVLISVLRQARLPYLPHLLWVMHPTGGERRQWGPSPSMGEKWIGRTRGCRTALKGSRGARWLELLHRGEVLGVVNCSSPHDSFHPLPTEAGRAAQAITASHCLPIPGQTWQAATGWWIRQWPVLPRPRAGSGDGLLESKYRHLSMSN